MSAPAGAAPLVSIILPTFNRRKFLPAAFHSIGGQLATTWEVVVVDDGSTDDTRQIVDTWAASVTQPVRYIYQANQGAYGARNTGVDAARGAFVAFYDSDDVWLPHHLSTSLEAFAANPDVDWVYSASELVDFESQHTLDPNCFYVNGGPRPFMRLRRDVRGPLHVITDPGVILCQIQDGLYCGLQNSVFRRRVFDRLRFATDLRNEAEDQLFAIRAAAAGYRLAYFDDVHVRYHVHGENSSASAKDGSVEKRRRVYDPLIEGYERLPTEVTLSATETRALRRRIGAELFWHLGYAVYWQAGERQQALDTFRRALRTWPWAVTQWKTYAMARLRTSLRPDPIRALRRGKPDVRVLYLTMNPNRESTLVPTEGWFRRLRGRGLEPVLVSSRAGAFYTWARGEGIPCYEVPLPALDVRRPWQFLASLAHIVRIGRKHRVQLVHCNEHDIYFIGQYAARLLRVPVVLSVHFTLRDGFSKWAFGGARCPTRMFFISKGSLDACRPDVAPVVPVSRWRLLYNGIDLDRFRPDADRRAAFRREHGLDGTVAVGVACALRPRKQLEHLFRAAAEVKAPHLRVVVAGAPVAGDEAYAEQLLQLGTGLLGDRLVPLGHLTDLRGFYDGLDLFVNTSQEEACSISVIESMASGTPILGYPSTSVHEQVLPIGGEIVPQDDVAALAAALGRWVADPARCASARVDARRRAEETFDIRQLADQLWSEYAAAVSDTAPPSQTSEATPMPRGA